MYFMFVIKLCLYMFINLDNMVIVICIAIKTVCVNTVYRTVTNVVNLVLVNDCELHC